MKTSVIVPVYNEEKTVGIILEKIQALEHIDEIVVVNDFSTDGTDAVLAQFENTDKFLFIQHQHNQGKTAAINSALKLVSGEVCVIQDADLEYDPDKLIDVLNPIYQNLADVVYGSRFLLKKSTPVLYYYHFLANKGLTCLSNLFTGSKLTDIQTCYKAFRTPIIKDIGLTSKGFGAEVEITAIVGRLKTRVHEVPIPYSGRSYHEGKKIGLKDGLYALWYIFYYNLYYTRTAVVKQHLENLKVKLNQSGANQ